MDWQNRKSQVALISVISNALLVLSKLGIGFLIGSVAVISEAIHSGVDLLASVIALYSVRTSSKPADRGHPFGHGKVENISGTIEAALIFLAAGWIVFEAVQKFVHPEPMEAPMLGFGVMLLSTLTNTIVSRMLFKVGRETDSVALLADAWHLRTDVYTSAGVMAGLAFISVGAWFFPGYNLHWLDPLCAMGVALLIIKAAYDLTVQSARDLLDASLPADEEGWIRKFLASQKGSINGYHALKTRKAGHFRFVEFHIQVDPQMSVAVSHELTEELCIAIKGRILHSTVTIHVEPCTRECNDKCLAGCLLSSDEKNLR